MVPRHPRGHEWVQRRFNQRLLEVCNCRGIGLGRPDIAKDRAVGPVHEALVAGTRLRTDPVVGHGLRGVENE
jgi:hypothetical protein